MNFDIKIMNYK